MTHKALVQFLVAVMFATSSIASAAESPADRALAQAKALAEHMKNFDSDGAASLTYLRFFERMGMDPAKVIQASAKLNDELRAASARYTRFELGPPRQPFAGDGLLYVFIPYLLEMEVRGKRHLQEAFLIGVSEDQGQSWKFVDGVSSTPQNITTVIPGYGGAPLPPKRLEVFN